MPAHRHAAIAAACLMLFAARASVATPLALTTGLSASMASGTTALLTLSATNLPGGIGAISSFNGFGLALQLIPQAGASGTVQFANFVVPAANGILPDPGDPQFELNGITNLSPVNGSAVATPVALLMNEAAEEQETVVPTGVLKNLGVVQVVSSPSAVGTWTLYAVNDAFGRSYWTDAFGNETPLDQLPATNGTALAIGTVTVVPEPSQMALAAGAAALILAASRGRGCRSGR